jgi:uncharacterized membrane protein
MDWSRLAAHLGTGVVTRQRLFPAATLRRIQQAVAEAERGHSGEIRFAVETALPAARVWRGVSARERAVELFGELRIWDTEHNNGVLVYLLLADRDVEIIADRGIDARVGATGWEAVCRAMEQRFRGGEFEAGAIAGVQAVGDLLRRHYPVAGDTPNELLDTPVLR